MLSPATWCDLAARRRPYIRQQFYVVAPAVVDDQALPRFEDWWAESTSDATIFCRGTGVQRLTRTRACGGHTSASSRTGRDSDVQRP